MGLCVGVSAQQQRLTSLEDLFPQKYLDYCDVLHADFLRRMRGPPWFRNAPFSEVDGKKYTPYISEIRDGMQAEVRVGTWNQTFKMVPSNDPDLISVVTHVYIVDQHDEVSHMFHVKLDRDTDLKYEFFIKLGQTKLRAFAWHNLYGLFEGPVIDTKGKTREQEDPGCFRHPVPHDWEFIVADLVRRQKEPPFDSDEPFTEDKNKTHTPWITVTGGIGTVRVGGKDESPGHPVVASNAPHEVQWITHIYVMDEDDHVIVVKEQNPVGKDDNSVTFKVPYHAKTLTAYAFSNLHGLYMGPTVDAHPKEEL